MDEIQLKALAKINLGLDVTGKRDDGYHELRMVMQMLHLYDKVHICKKDEPGIELKVNLPFLPTDESNIMVKAAKLMMDTYNLSGGVVMTLEKHIPVAAGMAGGSTDAAAVLYGMNKIYQLGLSKKQLMAHGVKLGADVPYCLLRTTALSEGIGEILTPLPPMPDCHIVVAKPGISVSTKTVFGKLNVASIKEHPDIDGIVDAVKASDLAGIASKLGNTLEMVTMNEYPVIAVIKKKMQEGGALNALMSGSGPTVFGIFDDYEKARAVFEELKNGSDAKQVFLTKPVRYQVGQR